MRFSLSHGPWHVLFEGMFYDHEVSIYSNPESVVLVVIEVKEKGKISGVVVEAYKVFHAKGETEGFAETFPKEASVFIKHEENKTLKFFVLASRPSYSVYEEEEFRKTVNSQLKNLEASVEFVKQISGAYDLELTELSKADEETKNAFFTDPLSLPLVSGKSVLPGQREMQPETRGEVFLGLTKEGKPAKEPLKLFLKTGIFGENPEDRKHAMQLVAEGVMLSNSPAVVFDWNESFNSMNKPSEQEKELSRFQAELEPMGFPVKEFLAAQDAKVDLNLISPKGLLELFGAGKNTASRTISEVMEKMEKIDSFGQLIGAVKNHCRQAELKQNQMLRMVRMLKLIEKRYEGLFASGNEVQELSKNWEKNIGRAGIIKMQGTDERSALMVMHSVLAGIRKHYERKAVKGINSFVFIPNAVQFFGKSANAILVDEMIQILSQFYSLGVGFALGAERVVELKKEARDLVEAEIFILSVSDVGVKLAERKQYRVSLRPTLSHLGTK